MTIKAGDLVERSFEHNGTIGARVGTIAVVCEVDSLGFRVAYPDMPHDAPEYWAQDRAVAYKRPQPAEKKEKWTVGETYSYRDGSKNARLVAVLPGPDGLVFVVKGTNGRELVTTRNSDGSDFGGETCRGSDVVQLRRKVFMAVIADCSGTLRSLRPRDTKEEANAQAALAEQCGDRCVGIIEGEIES